MSGIFNWGSRNTQVNKLGSVQVQTSEYGVCTPVLFGSNRLAAKLIDYSNFKRKTITESGGKGGGSVSGYEYYAAVQLFLWKNGAKSSGGVGNIYDPGGALDLTKATQTYTIPTGGGSVTVTHSGSAFYYDEGVTYVGSYSAEADDYGSDGLTTISGYDTLPMEKVSSSPTAEEYTCSATGTYAFSSSDAGKTVTISYSYTQVPTTSTPADSDIGAYAPAQYLNLSIYNGSRPQSAWGYSTHSIRYPGHVLASDTSMDLGSDATVPSYNFEGLNGNGLSFGSGIVDCDPKDIITAILTDAYIGMDYEYLGDLTQLSNYCVANGIFLSPYYDSATACSSVIEDLAKLANTEVFSSWDGKLKAVPYGDTTAVGFGVTFTPDTQPLYDLTVDDFLQDGDNDPLQIDYPDIADNSNYMKLEFKNRANSYNTDTIDVINQASVNVIGLRPADTITANGVTTAEVAQLVLNAQMTRKSYAYRKFKFKLNQCWPHLEVMDIVTVTHPNSAYNLTKWPVRLKSIEEDEKTGELTIEAEDFPWGSGNAQIVVVDTGGGVTLPGRELPGYVLAPVFYDAPQSVMDVITGTVDGGTTTGTTTSGHVLIAIAGQTVNWGGCHVWVSTDGTNYTELANSIDGQARMGYLLDAVSAVADPDATSTFEIVLTGADPGTLTSSSTAAADAESTLCLLGSELIAYSTVVAATVDGTAVQELTTYTRRGLEASTIAAHAANESFVRLDGLYSMGYTASQIGTKFYFKFTSFNLVNGMEEDLADCTAYTFTPAGTGYPAPPVVTITQSATNTSGSGSSSSASDGVTITSSGATTYKKVWLTITWTWPSNYPTPTGFNVVAFSGSDATAAANYLFDITTVGATIRSLTVAVTPTTTISTVNAAVEATYA